ncbi:hypothetical protein DYQ86_20845 [Acidobacteria bacterium AB60]|nr:hypothetical protein DYQ86_20845 [Acidobacteria bacterium AB60]
MSAVARCFGSCLLLLATAADAQVTAAPAQSTPVQSKTVALVPRVPGLTTLFNGLNAGVSLSTVHNSAIGWYSVLTPAVNYTFSSRYSADASTSLYLHRRVLQTTTSPPTQQLVVQNTTAGDTLLGLHATFLPGSLIDTASVYLSAPTGDKSAGLGTGKVTYDFNNHVERYRNNLGFLLDTGAGNSSILANDLLNKNYSSVGGLAEFQAGAILWLPKDSYVETIAYEQLPFGSQTIYTATGEHRRVPTKIVTSSGFAEDNGFVAFTGIRLTHHFTLSGYYNRSFRRKTDTVSCGITWVLKRAVHVSEEDSMIDRAIREAEKSSQH